ncbi:hypothetical protein LTR37_009323 [Vermiconidia calcicola]|uniref:Uncharacterized protein n=1 Tax=Vermiconidia calcicola TaxID=1690605 RepID=A0ACC3N8L4_9PEZI|nr:hypothetical protein LTR37_009323 [Vermiconidia calcicola]
MVFSKKRRTQKEDAAIPPQKPAAQPQQRPAANSDSGYGSSVAASSTRSDITPIENHGQVSGVNENRHLAVNTTTGDIVDDDTGEVVRTVTTTTTTTTTTRRSRSPQPPPPQQQTQTQTVGSGAGSAETVQPPPQPPRPQQHLAPETAAHPPLPQRPPELQHLDMYDSAAPTQTRRNTGQSFGNGISPVTPTQQNHNNPTRPPLQTGGNPAQQSPMANLKGAAVGLHGVGETLRGTINNEVDRRYPRRNVHKAEAANSKNQATIQTGQEEMGRVVSGGGAKSQWQAPWQDPAPPPVPQDERVRKRKSLSEMPAPFSPESNGQVGEKSSRFLRSRKSPAR